MLLRWLLSSAADAHGCSSDGLRLQHRQPRRRAAAIRRRWGPSEPRTSEGRGEPGRGEPGFTTPAVARSAMEGDRVSRAETGRIPEERSRRPFGAKRSPPLGCLRDVSRAELKRRREEFWHTRVSGNPQAWSVLKMAAEAMLNGEVDTANAIVDAGGIITPNGTLSICYDDLGGSYEVPRFAYSDPANLLETVEVLSQAELPARHGQP
eukprot:scaffold556_cov221-Pinguiococcus_pyrenoidosus.AAC.19